MSKNECMHCGAFFTGNDRYGLPPFYVCHVCDRRGFLRRWTDGYRARGHLADWFRVYFHMHRVMGWRVMEADL